MQLESSGYIVLFGALLCWLQVSAVVPALWRKEGIDFDIGQENLGERGVDEETIDAIIRSPHNQMQLIKTAYRWLSELDQKKERDARKLDDVELNIRAEEQNIDQLSEKVQQNTKQIQHLQEAICSLMKAMCDQKLKPCEACPWALPGTTNKPTKTSINPTLSSTPRPSPDPTRSCGKPEAPDNGFVEANSTNLNALTVLHCNTGFDLIGSDRMICTAIWNEANAEYQYSWAPPMSAICKDNGKPTPPTTRPPISAASAAKKPSKREVRQYTEESVLKTKNWDDELGTQGQYDSIAVRGVPARCLKPKVVGVCKAAIPRFYFNEETGDCEKFIFGGCRGNDNNFKSKTDCLCQCKKCP